MAEPTQGRSLWTLVDRYDATLSFLRSRVATLREQLADLQEMGQPSNGTATLLNAWYLALKDCEYQREAAARGAEQCAGPRPEPAATTDAVAALRQALVEIRDLAREITNPNWITRLDVIVETAEAAIARADESEARP